MPFRKILVTVVGGTILVFGLALLVLPGPAFVVIPIGLAVLATEFVWARRWLRRARGMVNRRKARRTTQAVWITCRRKWDRFRFWLLRWRRPTPPAPADRVQTVKEKAATVPAAVSSGVPAAAGSAGTASGTAPCPPESPMANQSAPAPPPCGSR